MSLSIGIVGLPNVGKSTLFNALAGAALAEAANYPFCTIEPNLASVPVPDPRLDRLAALFRPRRKTPTTIAFVDIAGLVAGASRGEGLGNQFLSHVREVDALAHVLRCFDDPDVAHLGAGAGAGAGAGGAVDPRGDRDVVETELVLKDLESVERRRERAQKAAKAPGPPGEAARAELEALDRVRAGLEKGTPLRLLGLGPEDRAAVADLFLLTAKPVIYVANVDERQLADPADARVAAVREMAAAEKAEAVVVCGKAEAEIAELPEGERAEFLRGLGLEETGLDRLVHAGQRVLGLLTFFTVGPEECRATTVPRGSLAPRAAGAIHSDFEKGFIRAEVVRCQDLLALGSEAAAREKGILRIEGRDYAVQDGDVIHFRFSP